MSYDNWKTTNPADDGLGSARQSGDRRQPEPTLVERLRRLGSDSGDEYDWEVCGRGADRIETLEAALREMVYETTHHSPLEPDGSHKCRITAVTLANARAALSGLPLAAGSAT